MVSVGRDQCGRAQYPPARTDGSDHTEFSPLALWCLSAGLGGKDWTPLFGRSRALDISDRYTLYCTQITCICIRYIQDLFVMTC